MLKWTNDTMTTPKLQPLSQDLYQYSTPVPHERLRHVASVVRQLIKKSESK